MKQFKQRKCKLKNKRSKQNCHSSLHFKRWRRIPNKANQRSRSKDLRMRRKVRSIRENLKILLKIC